MIDVEFKGIVEDLTNKYVSVLDLNQINESVEKNLRESYVKGLDDIGIKLNMNFTSNPERFNLIKKFTFENINGMKEDLADNLRKELMQSLINLESSNEMKDRVIKVLDVTINRARMIARTEMNRASNMGQIDGARQSGLKLLKRWNAHLDNRTSPICRALNGKTIPMNDKFHYDGKVYDTPPAHPNCRSVLDILDAGNKSFSEEIADGLKHKYIKRTGGPGNYKYWYKDPKTGKLTNTPPVRSFKRRTVNNLFNMNSKSLANEMKGRVDREKMQTIKQNVNDFKKGNDTKGKYYDKKTDTWSPERTKEHKRISKKYNDAAKQAVSKGKAEVLFLAGLPASGKTFLTKKLYKPVEGSNILKEKDGKKYLVLNADDIKEQFKKEYDGGNGAVILHNESSYLNSQFIKKYTDENVNIIVDGTLAKTDKAKSQIEKFKEKGYGTSLIFVDVPVNQAIVNAMSRTREEGRYVSPDIIIDYHEKIRETVNKLSTSFDDSKTIDGKMTGKDEEILLSNYNYAMGGDK